MDHAWQMQLSRWSALLGFLVAIAMDSPDPLSAAFIVCWGIFTAAERIIKAIMENK